MDGRTIVGTGVGERLLASDVPHVGRTGQSMRPSVNDPVALSKPALSPVPGGGYYERLRIDPSVALWGGGMDTPEPGGEFRSSIDDG